MRVTCLCVQHDRRSVKHWDQHRCCFQSFTSVSRNVLEDCPAPQSNILPIHSSSTNLNLLLSSPVILVKHESPSPLTCDRAQTLVKTCFYINFYITCPLAIPSCLFAHHPLRPSSVSSYTKFSFYLFLHIHRMSHVDNSNLEDVEVASILLKAFGGNRQSAIDDSTILSLSKERSPNEVELLLCILPKSVLKCRI